MRKKETRNVLTKCLLVLIILFVVQSVMAQTKQLLKDSSKLEIKGTSTMHDWEMDAEEMEGSIMIDKDSPLDLKNVDVKIKTEGLKSGKSLMDNKTYKALFAKDYPYIKYNLVAVEKVSQTDKGYKLKTEGKLTIYKTTKVIYTTVDVTIDNGIYTVSGKQDLKMTDFGIEPPEVLFMKTGDDISIEFTVKFK